MRAVNGGDGEFGRRAALRAVVGSGAAMAGVGSRAAAQQTRTIDMTDSLVFDPDDVTVAPGTTVVWENVGNIGHSVTAYEDDIPEGAAYFASGGFESESAARNAYPEGDVAGGESYEHTFEVAGTYEYFCIPHESAGMLGTIEVVEGGGGEGTTTGPTLPGSAMLLAVATSVALVAILGLAFFFMKYGGDFNTLSKGE